MIAGIVTGDKWFSVSLDTSRLNEICIYIYIIYIYSM